MNRKKRVHFFRLLLLLASLFLGWRYYHKGTLIDESYLSGKFESAINEVLYQHGVQDLHVSRVNRIERKKNFPLPTTWIETEREILLPSHISLPTMIQAIKQVGPQFKIDLFSENRVASNLNRSAQKEKTIVECGRGDQLFQRLIFLERPHNKS